MKALQDSQKRVALLQHMLQRNASEKDTESQRVAALRQKLQKVEKTDEDEQEAQQRQFKNLQEEQERDLASQKKTASAQVAALRQKLEAQRLQFKHLHDLPLNQTRA